MRICDIPTRIDDTMTLAAIYLCLLRMLWRLKRNNVTWRRYNTLLINENRWRAMRYGMDDGLIDFGRRSMAPYRDLLEEILELTAEDALALGCADDVMRAREIADRGTSADRQLSIYAERLAAGATPREALNAVVDWLIEETLVGIDASPPAVASPSVANSD
jgi:carboxylate-amine ligase